MAKKEKFSFTNSQGETFPLLPLNPLEEQLIADQLEAEWKAAGKALPEPPAYETENAAGERVRIQITEREQANTPELQAAWDAYEAAQLAMAEDQSQKFLLSCYLCVDANPDDYPKWKARMRLRGFPIPEDEGEKLVLFCRTWVIRGTDDIPNLIFAVTNTVAKMSPEAREAAEAMFRRAVEAAVKSSGPGAG